MGLQVGGGVSLAPQATAVLAAYEAHLSQAYGEQRAQNVNLSKVSQPYNYFRHKGCR